MVLKEKIQIMFHAKAPQMAYATKFDLRLFVSKAQEAEPGDADGDVGDEVEQAEDEAEPPEVLPDDIAATVVNRRRAGAVGRDDPHQAEGQAEQHGPAHGRGSGELHGDGQKHRQQGADVGRDAGEEVV